jgi:hypothetical protein
MLSGRVWELLDETDLTVPALGELRPVLKLVQCERSEKERVIRVDAYCLTITFAVPEYPEAERTAYAYGWAGLALIWFNSGECPDGFLRGAGFRALNCGYIGGRGMAPGRLSCGWILRGYVLPGGKFFWRIREEYTVLIMGPAGRFAFLFPLAMGFRGSGVLCFTWTVRGSRMSGGRGGGGFCGWGFGIFRLFSARLMSAGTARRFHLPGRVVPEYGAAENKYASGFGETGDMAL